MPQQKQQRDGSVSRSPRICEVCGDKAKSMHFGGLSCDSCKAFFRRAVFRDAFLKFTCPCNNFCEINIVSRKCCQYCRYQKCTSIGMSKSHVIADDERKLSPKPKQVRSVKKDNQKSQKNDKQLETFEPDPSTMLDFMSKQEHDEIEQIIFKYHCSYRDIPYKNDLKDCSANRPGVQIVNMFTTIVKRFAYFARLFVDFCELPSQDQSNLLRNGILDMCLIRGVQAYDTENNCWPNTKQLIYKDAPTLRIEDIKKLVSFKLYETHIKFITSMKDLNLDEPVMMILLMILLFTNDKLDLIENKKIQQTQEKYLMHLRKYMTWRYGPRNTSLLYPKLLVKLADLRELNDQHTEFNLRLAEKEVQEIQNSLGKLNLNPYPNWPHIMEMGGKDFSSNSHTNAPLVLETANTEQLTNLCNSTSQYESQHRKESCVDITSMIPESTSIYPEYIQLGKQKRDSQEIAKMSEKDHAYKSSGNIHLIDTECDRIDSNNTFENSNFDFHQLETNSYFKSILINQLKKSVIDIIDSPDFGLGDLLPNSKNTQQEVSQKHTKSCPNENHQRDHQYHLKKSYTTEQDISDFSNKQKQQQNTRSAESLHLDDRTLLKEQNYPNSYPLQNLEIGDSVSDLVYHIDYMESRQSNDENLQMQSQKAFQQLENHLITNITECTNSPQQIQTQPEERFHMQNSSCHNTKMLPQQPVLNPNSHYKKSASETTQSQSCNQQAILNTNKTYLKGEGGIELFRNLLEDFTNSDNPLELDAVTQLLGPELVSSIQQKLLGRKTDNDITHSQQCELPENENMYQKSLAENCSTHKTIQKSNSLMNYLSQSNLLAENEKQNNSHQNHITVAQLHQDHNPIEHATLQTDDFQLDLQTHQQSQPIHQSFSCSTTTKNKQLVASDLQHEIQIHHQHSQIHQQHAHKQIPFTSFQYQQQNQEF